MKEKKMMKNILLGTMLVVGSTLAHGSPIPDFPFVFATGQAENDIQPDTATMSFHIEVFDEVSSNAVVTVTARSIEVIAFLAKQGFSKGSLVTYELSKSEVRERKDYQDVKILGYEVTRRFELTIDDLSKYDLVARTLFKTDDVSDISTTFGRRDQKDIEAALLAEACAEAKRNASAMAAGFGKVIGDVHCISKQDFGNMGAVFGLGGFSFGGAFKTREAMPDQEAFLFIPTTIKFENEVAVLFTLEKK